jgi:putative component of toxin-antitoxin plasmid stabilization module
VKIVRLPEFTAWFDELPTKGKGQVDARLLRIRDHGHFGDAKNLGDGLAELRWKNG